MTIHNAKAKFEIDFSGALKKHFADKSVQKETKEKREQKTDTESIAVNFDDGTNTGTFTTGA